MLEQVTLPDRQAGPAQAVMAVAARGEKTMLRIANEAIAQVRLAYASSRHGNGSNQRAS